jgi:hypothetical protein
VGQGWEIESIAQALPIFFKRFGAKNVIDEKDAPVEDIGES